ncbi:HTH-type transcriptional regulator / antitoxin MqsA [Luteibacter sp. UNC138MFCol5.1]|uniref:type II toxin-antitoxin system MqsA family antitoxin n=1 Tax=Luteibacter sp. UNC138MFCol5.1 TaxID=1502774 RepID=UPI0008CB4128|nr:type II toxin-antitoxin system MqsA family antitoxin [Luteibacter sp. UNC138MFCol5.1]SEO74378.1 HTH-type transcriptional regulator / antitoxin MqsA [Luteibacter sp. UNC138MFCol5.1]
MTAKCLLCERGELRSAVVTETIRYDGTELQVPGVEISVCSVCGEELVLPEQAKANEVKFADAKRAHDGFFTSSEIVAWRKRHALTQQEAAVLIGGGVNAFSKYERGEVIQTQAVDRLMRSLDHFPAMIHFLRKEAGVTVESNVVLERDDKTVVALHLWKVTKTIQPANDSSTPWGDDVELEIPEEAYG